MATAQRTDGEVLGVAVNVCIDGVMSVFQSRMRDILDDHDIEKPDPKPEEWYPLRDFLDVLAVVEADVGENALKKIGEATPQFTEWPSETDSPEEALQNLVTTFDQTHRDVAGRYQFEQADDSRGRVTSTTPYPEAWETGFLKGATEIHGAEYARVSNVEETGEKTVYEIRW